MLAAVFSASITISMISLSVFSSATSSTAYGEGRRLFSVSPRTRAARLTVEPCNSAEVITTKKVALNMSLAFGSPASNGYVPSRIGTAPFSPAQEIKIFSRRENSDRNKLTQTPTGRARIINSTASENPGAARLVSCSGNTSHPNSTNMKICIIQAKPSLKRKIAGRYTSSELPAMIAMMYTARKPLPDNSAVRA